MLVTYKAAEWNIDLLSDFFSKETVYSVFSICNINTGQRYSKGIITKIQYIMLHSVICSL